jgi:hypothetical protein
MLLADLIADAVARPGYGGGLHREQLAKMVRRHPYTDKFFTYALMHAYRLGKIDFCMGYVVAPPKKLIPVGEGVGAFLSVEEVPGEVVNGYWAEAPAPAVVKGKRRRGRVV